MAAETRLTKEQQLLTRAFIDNVLADEKLFRDTPAQFKSTLTYLYQLLGYQILPNGAGIPLGTEVKTSYGEGFSGETFKDYPDEYHPDGEKLRGIKSKRSTRSSK